jgi:hypothetical protein
MKLKLAYIIGAFVMASNANAAIYAVQNLSSGYAYSDGLFQNADNSLLDGGIVAMGTFTGTGFQVNDIATTISNFQLLASALAGSNSTTLGGSFPGYVETSFDTSNVEGANTLIGQDLYVFVGNASTLAASTAFGLFKTATIQSDFPNEQTYLANPFSAINAGELLMGGAGTFTGNASGLEAPNAVYTTLKLAAPIPEPSAAILGGLGALAACVRRRRN